MAVDKQYWARLMSISTAHVHAVLERCYRVVGPLLLLLLLLEVVRINAIGRPLRAIDSIG